MKECLLSVYIAWRRILFLNEDYGPHIMSIGWLSHQEGFVIYCLLYDCKQLSNECYQLEANAEANILIGVSNFLSI